MTDENEPKPTKPKPTKPTIRDTTNPLIKNATGCLFMCTNIGKGEVDGIAIVIAASLSGDMIISFGTGDGTADGQGKHGKYLVPIRAAIEACYELFKAGQ